MFILYNMENTILDSCEHTTHASCALLYCQFQWCAWVTNLHSVLADGKKIQVYGQCDVPFSCDEPDYRQIRMTCTVIVKQVGRKSNSTQTVHTHTPLAQTNRKHAHQRTLFEWKFTSSANDWVGFRQNNFILIIAHRHNIDKFSTILTSHSSYIQPLTYHGIISVDR